jgi:predicted O-linked N-acetylglucosamine transferase (SPINDLY family)
MACYSSTHHEDAVTDRLRSKSDLWRGIAGLKPAAAAEIIRRDRMDVLIDLAGHTGGHSLEVMALRPAPVQMTYAGWPGTTGVAAIDYRITDTITDPPEAERYSTERLLRLDPCAVSYRAAGTFPAVAVPGAGPFTFACFGAPTKFNRPLLTLWARILHEVPASRLLIKHLGLSDPTIREGVAGQLIGAGFRPDSFEVLPASQGLESHLGAYHSVHVSLDTLPYNGTVTICESLLMGVPVASMCGNTTAGRVGLSILTAVGVPELCAADGDAYVRLAVELAIDPARLHRVRSGLRERFLASPLCDGPSFARRFTDLVLSAASLRDDRPDGA